MGYFFLTFFFVFFIDKTHILAHKQLRIWIIQRHAFINEVKGGTVIVQDATRGVDGTSVTAPLNVVDFLSNPTKTSLVLNNISDSNWGALMNLKNENAWKILINSSDNTVFCQGSMYKNIALALWEKNNIRYI